MASIQNVITELSVIDKRIEQHTEHIAREQQYLNETIEKLRSNFGNDPAMLSAITYLFQANNRLAAADSSLYLVRKVTEELIKILQ